MDEIRPNEQNQIEALRAKALDTLERRLDGDIMTNVDQLQAAMLVLQLMPVAPVQPVVMP